MPNIVVRRCSGAPGSLLCCLLVCFGVGGKAWGVSFLTFDPRSVSMAGNGVATARPHNAGLFNPALLVGPDPLRRETHGNAYVGARLLDRDNFLDTADDFDRKYKGVSLNQLIHDLVDLRSIETANGDELRQATARAGELLHDINQFSDKPLRVGASAGFSFSHQRPNLGLGVYYRRFAVLGSEVLIADRDNAEVLRAIETVDLLADLADQRSALDELVHNLDSTTLSDLLERGQALHRTLVDLNDHVRLLDFIEDFSAGTVRNNRLQDYLRQPLPDNFESQVHSEGAEVSELGFGVARHAGSRWRVGATLKLVEFTAITFSQDIADYDAKAYRDGENRRRHVRLNLDGGVLYEIDDRWQIGLVARNLIPYDFRTAEGTRIPMRPIVRAGLGYIQDRLRISADLDLTRNEPLGFDPDKQFLGVGVEWFAWRNTALRAGFRSNLVDGEFLPSLGVGFGGRHVHVDFSIARAPRNDEWALALGVGVALD